MSFFNDISKLPHNLKSNYIFEAIIELRYQTSVPIELVTVKLSEALGSEYKHPIKIFEVPEIVRKNIPDSNNAICYIIRNAHKFFTIGIGSGLISLKITNFSYGTWKVFIDEFKKIYEKISSFVTQSEQIGVRYINVFNGNVLPDLDVDINISSEKIIDKPLVLSWQIEEKKRIIKSSVATKTLINYADFETGENKTIKDASVFDIDCIYRDIEGIKTDIFKEIEINHDMVKGLFFGVCKKDFVENKLVPIDGE